MRCRCAFGFGFFWVVGGEGASLCGWRGVEGGEGEETVAASQSGGCTLRHYTHMSRKQRSSLPRTSRFHMFSLTARRTPPSPERSLHTHPTPTLLPTLNPTPPQPHPNPTPNQPQALLEKRTISAGHDISDGGIATTLLEMAFAGRRPRVFVWFGLAWWFKGLGLGLGGGVFANRNQCSCSKQNIFEALKSNSRSGRTQKQSPVIHKLGYVLNPLSAAPIESLACLTTTVA